MGYFSNGSEGRDYDERYCVRCVNYGPEEGPGCPIWGAHLVWSYKLCNDDPKESTGKAMLDSFIPRSKDGLNNEQCKMFSEIQPQPVLLEAWQEPGRAAPDPAAGAGG